MKLTKEVKIGLIVIVGIGLFIYGFNFLKGSNLFNHEKTVYAVYTNVDGLLESAIVQLNGMKVGVVKSVDLIPNDKSGKILVIMSISDHVRMPKDSRARIISSDLLGSKAIRVELGSGNQIIRSGDTIKSEIEDDLKTTVDKRIAPLQKKAEGLISSIDSVMVVVQQVLNKQARENLVKSFESIKISIQTFERTSSRLDTLVATQQHKLSNIFSKVESITNNLANNNEKVTHILVNFESISDSLAKSKIRSTVNHANDALADVSLILDKINTGKGSIGMLVNNDSLYRKLDHSAQDLDLLLKDLKEHPKRYVHFSVFGGRGK